MRLKAEREWEWEWEWEREREWEWEWEWEWEGGGEWEWEWEWEREWEREWELRVLNRPLPMLGVVMVVCQARHLRLVELVLTLPYCAVMMCRFLHQVRLCQ